MQVVVEKAHISEYPNPIHLNKGDRVRLEQVDDQYPNWILVSTESGMQGWAPVQYLDKSPDQGVAILLCDYDAVELNTELGERLTVLFELNDWYRVSSVSGETGWVPVDTVKKASVD